MTQITVSNLSLSRGSQRVLTDVSFTVKPGEVVMILGPSGSGKSTLLRTLNRLIEPPPQSIYFQGEDITTIDVIQLRRKVGLVFQQASIFFGTVYDNLMYGPNLSGKTLTEQRAVELLQTAGLPASFLYKNASQLSGGEAQRVALARTLANQPQLLLLDEPTSALDPIATRNVEDALLALDLTLVWVSHTIEQAQRVGARILFLQTGSVIADGPFDTVLTPNHPHPAICEYMTGQDTVT